MAPCPKVIRLSGKHTHAFQTSHAALWPNVPRPVPATSCPHQCHQQTPVAVCPQATGPCPGQPAGPCCSTAAQWPAMFCPNMAVLYSSLTNACQYWTHPSLTFLNKRSPKQLASHLQWNYLHIFRFYESRSWWSGTFHIPTLYLTASKRQQLLERKS